MPIIADVYDKTENKISIICLHVDCVCVCIVYIFIRNWMWIVRLRFEEKRNSSFKIPVVSEYIQNNDKTLICIFLMNSTHHHLVFKMPKNRLQDNE